LAKAALAVGIGAVARTVRSGGSDDLIENHGAMRISGHKAEDFVDEVR
jgi:hypothetical protein